MYFAIGWNNNNLWCSHWIHIIHIILYTHVQHSLNKIENLYTKEEDSRNCSSNDVPHRVRVSHHTRVLARGGWTLYSKKQRWRARGRGTQRELRAGTTDGVDWEQVRFTGGTRGSDEHETSAIGHLRFCLCYKTYEYCKEYDCYTVWTNSTGVRSVMARLILN